MARLQPKVDELRVAGEALEDSAPESIGELLDESIAQAALAAEDLASFLWDLAREGKLVFRK